MSDTKKIVRADLDEIVEAVVGEVFGLEAVRDSIIAEDDNFLITPTELRTAIERFVQPNEWISVKERLPKLEQSVLLFDKWKSSEGKDYEDIRVGYLNRIETYKTLGEVSNHPEWIADYAFNITHWMPLPESPKKGGEDEG